MLWKRLAEKKRCVCECVCVCVCVRAWRSFFFPCPAWSFLSLPPSLPLFLCIWVGVLLAHRLLTPVPVCLTGTTGVFRFWTAAAAVVPLSQTSEARAGRQSSLSKHIKNQ